MVVLFGYDDKDGDFVFEINTNGSNKDNTNRIKIYKKLSEILSNIQNGKYILPKAEVCIDSIQKFDEQAVINKIEEVIIKTYYKFYGFTRL